MKRIRTLTYTLLAASTLGMGAAVADHNKPTEKQVEHHDVRRAEIRAFMKLLDEAHYNPAVLDEYFFEKLAYAPEGGREHRAFYNALPDLNWYRAPYARGWMQQNHPRLYGDFIAENQVQVFIKGSKRNPFYRALADKLGYYAPDHVAVTDYRYDADIIINVQELAFDRTFAIRSKKDQRKKYKKYLRKDPNPHQRLTRALYTEVKEEAAIHYDYRISFKSRGRLLDRDRFYGTEYKTFKTGENLRAINGFGQIVRTDIFPRNKVRKKFERNSDGYRAHVMAGVEEDVMNALSARIAHYDFPLRYELYGGRRHYSARW